MSDKTLKYFDSTVTRCVCETQKSLAERKASLAIISHKVIDPAVIWKGFISWICMSVMKCLYLMVHKLWPRLSFLPHRDRTRTRCPWIRYWRHKRPITMLVMERIFRKTIGYLLYTWYILRQIPKVLLVKMASESQCNIMLDNVFASLVRSIMLESRDVLNIHLLLVELKHIWWIKTRLAKENYKVAR